MELITFTAQDYASLKTNIYGMKKTELVLRKFEQQFKGWPEFKQQIPFNNKLLGEAEKDQVVRYITLLYDPLSPYVEHVPDVNERKMQVAACDLVGFKYSEEGHFDELANNLFRCKIREVNRMIVRYIHSFSNPSWLVLATGWEAMSRKAEQMLEEPDDVKDRDKNEETKGKLFNQIKILTGDLKDIAAEILMEKNYFLNEDLFRFVDKSEASQLKLTVERMSERWQEL